MTEIPLLIVSKENVVESLHTLAVVVGECDRVGETVGETVGQRLQEIGHSSCTTEPFEVIGQNFSTRSALVSSSELALSHEHFLWRTNPSLIFSKVYVSESVHDDAT